LNGIQRYFFHIRESDDLELEVEGIKFAYDAAARIGATSAAKEMVLEAIVCDMRIDGRRLEIMSAGGGLVAVVSL